MTGSFLDRIVPLASARAALIDFGAAQNEAARKSSVSQPFRFRASLETETAAPRIIAEIKSASPSAGTILPVPAIELIATEYERGGAIAISVVTEPHFFHGSTAWIARAAAASGLPVLMKDFVVSEAQVYDAIASGADALLLIASLLDASSIRAFSAILAAHGRDALVEIHDRDDLQKAIDAGAAIVGVNNRNLRDLSVSIETSESLAAALPAGVIRVAESGIRSRADVERLAAAGFDAFLVGESILRESDREAAVARLARPSREGRC